MKAPGQRLSEEALREAMGNLPAVLHGLDELVVHLKLPTQFVRDWMRSETAERLSRPVLPHIPMQDGRPIFYTGLVIQWQHEWFPPGSMEGGRGKSAGSRRGKSSRHQAPGSKEAPDSNVRAGGAVRGSAAGAAGAGAGGVSG